MSTAFRSSPTRVFALQALPRAVRSIALGAALAAPVGAALFSGSAFAQSESAKSTFSIPAGSLSSALASFTATTGVKVLAEGAAGERRSPGLQGSYTAQDGLLRLLAGTGANASRQADGSYLVLSANSANSSALALDAITVNSQGLGLTTENTGSYTTGATSTATKLPLSLRETPQSVSVVTRQLMDDQNLTSIDDVLKFTPGITSNHRDSDRYTFYSRGFQIQNFMYDGIPSQVANESQQYTSSLLDMALYDRVEVVRGATGLMSGAGTPSATVNLVRKRPTQDFQAYVSGEAGAWDRYRSEADVSGPLNAEGTIRGRLVGVYEKSNSFADWYKTEKKVMYGALDVDLSEDTLLRLSLDYQNNDSDGVSFGHIPLFYNNGSQTNFSRSFNPAARWSYLDNTHYNFTTLLEHKLANDWSLKAAYSHQYSYRRGTVGSASGGQPDPGTGEGVFMFVNRLDSYQEQDTLDVYASGPFQLGGREHQLVVGGSTSRTHLNYPTYQNQNPDVPNIFAWDGHQLDKPHLSRVGDNVTTLQQTGFYTAANFKPFDPLSIIIGTRVSSWKQNDFSSNFATDEDAYSESTDRTKKSGVVTPYAGIIYDINDTYSVYASYTDIFLPQTFYKTAANTSLDPLEGDNYEIGLKGEFFNGALNASIALFDVEQKNTPQFVGEDAVTGREVYRAISGTSTKGVEAEISGELADGLNVFGGYTYRESHDKNGERVETNQPSNLFKLGTTYRLPGAWNRLTIGGNVIWQSEIYAANEFDDGVHKATQDPYAVVGLLANYKVDDHLTVGANLDNLFDRKYYDGLGTFNSGSYGEPRNLMFNAKWKF
jgi:outer membrane receptor for ferric coprogen and ferric-rhodotorulic acid